MRRARALKQDVTLRRVPVILIGEAGEPHIDWRAVGADSFHPKTFDAQGFPAFLHQFLESQRRPMEWTL